MRSLQGDEWHKKQKKRGEREGGGRESGRARDRKREKINIIRGKNGKRIRER